jgi:cation diffusion facilitator CzcD-associated flavoprotein CzcO
VSAAAPAFDVLIVGAGLSGIGAASYLRTRQPGRRYAILEARDDLGGTWDLFRFPGIRSDSDLHTFGYAFKPWRSPKVFADGATIKAYLAEAAREHGIDRHIRYGHRVVRAAWSTRDARWTVTVERATGETCELAARWLFCATGYYRYDEGYTPRLEGIDRFGGTVVHPQHWPADLDHAGRRVVVVGSGATAVTLIPAIAAEAAHVTMLQRSPSYILPVPDHDGLPARVGRLLGEDRAYRLTRRKNIARQRAIYRFCQRFPVAARRLIRWVNAKQLEGSGCDVDVHFNPVYGPWDQRLCIVPDGDLFRVIRSGRASVVTDRIDTVTETGITLASGRQLSADVIVLATGLNLLAFGGLEIVVDGAEVSLPDTVAYKGLMLSGVPNLAFALGYTNASWTLKVDLVCEHFCRLLAHADRHGHDACVPELGEPGMARRPLLDFQAGYVLRSLDALPKQGDRAPWRQAMDYAEDRRRLRRGVADPHLRWFSAAGVGSEHDLVPA